MFDRSRYNWAVTQIETSCKFDYAATEEAIDAIKGFLDSDEIYRGVNQARKQNDLDWYQAIAGLMFVAAPEQEFAGVRRMYALIVAGCVAAAKMVDAGQSPRDVLSEAYARCGLDPAELAVDF